MKNKFKINKIKSNNQRIKLMKQKFNTKKIFQKNNWKWNHYKTRKMKSIIKINNYWMKLNH